MPTTTVHALRWNPPVAEVADALRAHVELADHCFDRFLPEELRRVAEQHWTPVAVALRVARFAEEAGLRSVVDLGSGAGKLCVIGALGSRCRFTGIEQRLGFVAAARDLALLFGVEDQASFVAGELDRCAIPDADAYYLFNPFGENLFGAEEHLDQSVELGLERYQRDVAAVEEFFARARVGTFVIEYNGFGGQLPRGYEQLLVDRTLPNLLRISRKST